MAAMSAILVLNRHDLYNLKSTNCTQFQLNPTSGSGEDFFSFSQNAPLRGPEKGAAAPFVQLKVY